MELKGMQKVHIVPVGFEQDRIVEPLEKVGADKVILFTSKKDIDKTAEGFYQSNKKSIKSKITKEIERVECNLWDLTEVLNKLCTIIYTEKEKNNIVLINVSSGNKLFSIAGTIAGMMYGAEIYYAKTEKTEQYAFKKEALTVGPYTLESVPHYTIRPPSDHLIKALFIVEKNPGIKQYDFIVELEKLNVISKIYEEDEQGEEITKEKKKPISKNTYGFFKRNFLLPLKYQEWIKIEESGKKMRISITERGKNTLRVFESIVCAKKHI